MLYASRQTLTQTGAGRALCLLKLAEVHGNRTHRGHLLPATGFEVQETHQDLTTSIFHTNRFSF